MCLVELWLWEKTAVGCELWESCYGLWAVEKLKAVWLNKYKIYLLSLSLLKQLWKSFLFHQFRKAESQKPKAGSNQLSKMYYEKTTASEKTASKSSPFGWAFDFLGQKPNAQPNGPWTSTSARVDKQDILRALANIHRWSSSVASIQDAPRLGAMPSKTHRFRCFQRLHAPRMTREFKPFCTCPSTKLFTLLHQSAKHPSSAEGESSWSPNRLRRQNQKCLANTQVTNRWSIVSSFLITVRTKS